MNENVDLSSKFLNLMSIVFHFEVFNASKKKKKKKISSNLLCDAGTALKSHCLHFIFTFVNEPIYKKLFDTFFSYDKTETGRNSSVLM